MRRLLNLSRAKPVMTDRTEGDMARERRDWAAAEKHYTAHLDGAPGDTAIWVQLGHARKEQGKLSEAEAAYRRALELTPEDADVHLQLGHALKLQSKRAGATAAYARSLELAPSRATFEELSAIEGVQRASKRLRASTKSASGTVYFEIDDLLGWLRAHKTLSGIQRVQVGIIRNVLAEVLQQDDERYVFVRTRNDLGYYWQIWASDLNEVVEYALGAVVVQAELIRLLDRAEQAAVQVAPSTGQCYFILGAFWGFNGDATRYVRLKRAGVAVGVYIYDLIPVTHPEFCDAHLVSDFALCLGDGLAAFDFVLTISDYTAQTVRRLQEKLELRRAPVLAVPLAHLLKDAEPDDEHTFEWTSTIAVLRNRRFVLSVSTIEARKNHIYLVTAWKLMLEEGLDPPDLVFVGRFGWRVNDLMEQMRATGFLNGRIHVLHDLSDTELRTLYRHCQFTAFPSLVEGWGLPVGESLAQGRPCIASNTTSIPEVGGDLVDYIDPYNLREGVEAFRRMSFDDAYRARRTSEVQTRFKARNWAQVTSELLAGIEQLRGETTDQVVIPLLRPGELFVPRELRLGHTIPVGYLKRPLRSILAESWLAPEDFGVWMRGDAGLLSFRSDLPPGTEITVIVHLAGVEWAASQFVHLNIGDQPDGAPSEEAETYPRRVQAGQNSRRIINRSFMMYVNGRIGDDAVVDVRLRVTGRPLLNVEQDPRGFYLGLVGLSYAARDDMELRSNIFEMLRGAT
jgi:glycosyltransferase involved in cell wall biosynthesis